MIFVVVVLVLGPALILRACRPGPHKWPSRRNWFEITL